jgi:hypothetical protein
VSGACREVGLLKINVERAEMDVLAGIQEQDWPKVSIRQKVPMSSACVQVVYSIPGDVAFQSCGRHQRAVLAQGK